MGSSLPATRDTKEAQSLRVAVIAALKEPSRRKRYHMDKCLKGSFRRVKTLVADMHHKVCSWLSTNHTKVLLPPFKTQDMTSKQKRISRKTSRAMLAWPHYKLKTLMSYKMGRAGGRVIECGEHYTTKACSCCGRTRRNITSEAFSCSHCSLALHCDVNAACSIYLKNKHLLARAPGKSGSPETPTPRCQVRVSLLTHIDLKQKTVCLPGP